MAAASEPPAINERLPPMVVLPVIPYAERFPTVPVFSIVECLLETWRDTSPAYVDDDWMTSFDRLATARLTQLVDVEPVGAPTHRRRPRRRLPA
jgi:hypothetical protein